MNETYQRIIPILSGSLDWRAICFEMAAHHPETFLDSYEKVHGGDINYRAKQVVIDTLNGTRDNKLRAVKAHRELTKSDLLTSKNFVEEVIHHLGL